MPYLEHWDHIFTSFDPLPSAFQLEPGGVLGPCKAWEYKILFSDIFLLILFTIPMAVAFPHR